VLAPVKTSNSTTNNSLRTIALSQRQCDALAAHLARFGTGPDDVVFHIDGRYVDRFKGGPIMASAIKRAGLADTTWHSLRHFHASTLLSDGVNPAYVAQRLGHDIAALLKIYAHVLPRDDDRIRAKVDRTLETTGEDEAASAL
jgi:integrase